MGSDVLAILRQIFGVVIRNRTSIERGEVTSSITCKAGKKSDGNNDYIWEEAS
jgi:hypothetical protein